MNLFTIILLTFSVLLVIILYIIITIVIKDTSHKHTPTYRKIIDVKNLSQLKQTFLWDNPNVDGTDPTGGLVDYSYGMSKDSSGNIINNINGDITWNEIKDNDTSKELLSEDKDGIKIKLSDNLLENKTVGAPRLISKKFFRGGLFIFDVEHVPIGCGIWPAMWLNGFIGLPDQYHQNETNPLYNRNMEKLANTTLGRTVESFNHTCSSTNSKIGRKDSYLSSFLGRDVYPMEWPGGGEIDIIEQTNFSPTNLISIHGGPRCEISTALQDTNFADPPITNDYAKLQVRSVCGDKVCKDDLIIKAVENEPRPDCPSQSASAAGNAQIKVLDGFGENFNNTKGGVYAVQWIPKEKIYVWFYPRKFFSKEHLEKHNRPLSQTPNPDTWLTEEIPLNSKKYYRTLVSSYLLNDENAITDSCDLNFQSIIINITVGGGWAGNVMPNYCSVNNTSNIADYLGKCYNANADRANNNQDGAVDPENGCYDGARSNEGGNRGIDSKAVFYSEAYFKIRSIKVFQNNKTDENVW